MGCCCRKAFLLLYILFLVHLHHHATSADPSHGNLSVQSVGSNPDGDDDAFAGITAELSIVIKKGGGGRGGGGGGGKGGRSFRGGDDRKGGNGMVFVAGSHHRSSSCRESASFWFRLTAFLGNQQSVREKETRETK
ncbi:unnamed protein product [Eruca vesicaria subsp. sativa]|uniref:Glycine-rich protein n=1 Tax=Eruca vesicaria subsp. sativa TaxID=29727 RepID=A0ABC8IXY3_ERUVS|nr:unnamed protein product [Eruca vesicaria subsp. sativa]